MGHSHQMGHIMFRGWEGLHEGYEIGCICRFDLEYIVGVPQWQQGWALVYFPPEGGYQVELVRVLDKKKHRIILADGEVWDEIGPAKRHIT